MRIVQRQTFQPLGVAVRNQSSHSGKPTNLSIIAGLYQNVFGRFTETR